MITFRKSRCMSTLENILQHHIQCKKGDVGKYVLLPGDPGRVKLIASYFNESWKVAENREFVTYTGFIDGIKVSVTSTGIGSPSASIAVEELANIGAEVFIRVGTCGGIDPSVRGGDLIIAHAAVRGEGTSREYLPIEFPAVADFYVTSALLEAAKRIGVDVKLGTVWTHDAFYRGTLVKWMPEYARGVYEPLLRGGVLCVENEAAGIFTVATIRRKKAGAILLSMGNNLREEEEELDENSKRKHMEKMILTAIEAVKILEGKSNAQK